MLAETIIKITEFINEHNVPEEDIQELADLLDIRVCDICGDLMWEGHYVDEAYEYYCDDECLNKSISKEEQEQLYEQDLLWWTEWI